MKSTPLNHFVLFLLFWLQSFAPLLHAHTHEVPASKGMHWHALDVLGDDATSVDPQGRMTRIGSDEQLITVEQGCRLEKSQFGLPPITPAEHMLAALAADHAVPFSQPLAHTLQRPSLIASGFLSSLQAQAPPAFC